MEAMAASHFSAGRAQNASPHNRCRHFLPLNMNGLRSNRMHRADKQLSLHCVKRCSTPALPDQLTLPRSSDVIGRQPSKDTDSHFTTTANAQKAFSALPLLLLQPLMMPGTALAEGAKVVFEPHVDPNVLYTQLFVLASTLGAGAYW